MEKSGIFNQNISFVEYVQKCTINFVKNFRRKVKNFFKSIDF